MSRYRIFCISGSSTASTRTPHTAHRDPARVWIQLRRVEEVLEGRLGVEVLTKRSVVEAGRPRDQLIELGLRRWFFSSLFLALPDGVVSTGVTATERPVVGFATWG